MKLILPLLVATLCVSSADATGLIVTLDASRCYSGAYQYYLTGNGMTGPLSQLIQGGWTVQETPLITPASLQGASVFVTGELAFGATLAPSEVTALQAFVAAGGGLLYMGEGNNWAAANIQFAAMVNGPAFGGEYGGFGVTDVIVAPTHPLIHGPGGTVTTLAGFNVPGFWTNPSPTTTVIATNPDMSEAVVAVTYQAGRAVLLNDVNYFAYPPTYTPDHAIFFDNTIDWLAGSGTPVTSFCSGDGTATACPCGNSGAAGAGCASSVGLGATLAGTGNASIANDSFVLGGSGMPNSSALYFQGTTQFNGGLGSVFGDGLRCAGGTIVRLGTKTNSGGSSAYPGPGDVVISIRGANAAGSTRTYQVWYRNAAAFCTPSTFNLSNGIQLTWGA
jgi:hypothetical protein